jgi:hypothetical protein
VIISGIARQKPLLASLNLSLITYGPDPFHHHQRVRVDADRRVAERVPAQPHQLALLTDPELRVVA